jgi:hypothetical protein
MGLLKEYYHEYLSAEDFDYMFDGEYEAWVEQQEINQEQYELEKAAYEEALAAGK